MPAAGAKRKRPNRKRKRRAVSISSSSSDSDNDSSSTDAGPKITVVKTAIASPEEKEKEKEETSDSDSDSDSSEDSDSDSSSEDAQPVLPKNDGPRIRSDSPGPIPPSASRIPSFLPSNSHESNEKSTQGGQQKGTEAKEAEEALREKFNKFWMSSLVEGFRDDLDTIRKDPTFTTSKLSMLIDSLASGTEVYSTSSSGVIGGREVNEMDIVLG